MDLRRPELLGIYLNDHLAGSVGGVETARRARGSNEGSEFGGPLERLSEEIEADRDSLEAVMEELGVARSRIKPAIGWLGEKLGRLKPNGQLRGYSPLSRVVELELLIIGITGKLRLWTLLAELVGEHSETDFADLIVRAADQRTRVEDLQVRAARLL
jgi:hypothetical protein